MTKEKRIEQIDSMLNYCVYLCEGMPDDAHMREAEKMIRHTKIDIKRLHELRRPRIASVGNMYRSKEAISIAIACCQSFGIPLEDIGKETRKREYTDLRATFVYILKKHFPRNTYVSIGEMLRPHSPFDHTSVLNMQNSAIDFITTEETFRNRVYAIEKRLRDECIIK